jgi:hypothetical protein
MTPTTRKKKLFSFFLSSPFSHLHAHVGLPAAVHDVVRHQLFVLLHLLVLELAPDEALDVVHGPARVGGGLCLVLFCFLVLRCFSLARESVCFRALVVAFFAVLGVVFVARGARASATPLVSPASNLERDRDDRHANKNKTKTQPKTNTHFIPGFSRRRRSGARRRA